jgi:clorobiocin/coumermycin A biosynthesis protein CloN6/CouN6
MHIKPDMVKGVQLQKTDTKVKGGGSDDVNCLAAINGKPHPSLPRITADLVLLHPPAFFDFRERRDIYFPFLGTSGDVPVTPLYEYFPVGFKTLQRYLTERGHDVKLINLSTVLLRYPKIDFDRLVEALEARLIGIDLHWMAHVQGSLAVGKRIKEKRPDMPIILGGISSTYYADDLIRYPFVDMVMRGYDTHEPMANLIKAIKHGGDMGRIQNLLWKSKGGEIRDNLFTHRPATFGCGIDWSIGPADTTVQSLPILEILSTQNAGCVNNCGWCGGSSRAFQRVYKSKKAIVFKPLSEVKAEFDALSRLPGAERYHYYTVGLYNEPKNRLDFFLDRVAEANLKSISYEQFYLTPDSVLKQMALANRRTTITLSPQSHDLRIAKLSGRGVYTNEQLERWIARALDSGIFQVDIWYFIGMPEQDERSVMETVDYCYHLLHIFKGKRVNPMICPMLPFLDPACEFFAYPERHGYRLFYRTPEEHRRGMERASIINRINYETKWLKRSDLIYVGFRAIKQLMEAKAESGILPSSWVKDFNAKTDDALDFIGIVHEADCIANEKERTRELERFGDEILRRNKSVFFSGVMNQAFPVNRQIGGRWFDEMGWDSQVLESY